MGRKHKDGSKPGYKDLIRLKKIKALMESETMKDAYLKLHPNVKDSTAKVNGAELLTPEIFAEIKKLMGLDAVVTANKDVLEKVLFLVIARWMAKEEKTGDMIAAVRELTKLVPEFKDKLQVEDITNASEEELDRKLRGFGYDPSIVTSN